MTGKLTGGLTNYYLAPVLHPQRPEQPAYTAECEDITAALQMTPNEFCEFKAIWRTAAARLGNGKPTQKALYDAEKRVHYAKRDLLALRREAGLVHEIGSPTFVLNGSTYHADQWWMKRLLELRDQGNDGSAITIAVRILEAVLPKC